MASRKPAFAFETVTPCWITSVGRRGSASVARFCVCTAAMSGSVPGSKVSVIEDSPFELEDEVKYSRLLMPVSCCSITWVTACSTVSALAPGYPAEMLI